MILWFTGNTGSGKTTVAKNAIALIKRPVILLDGDQMRQTISLGAGFSKEEREAHNLRVARLANLLSEQGHIVFVCLIAPFEDIRTKIQKICAPVWVYVAKILPEDEARPYEMPEAYGLKVDNDAMSEGEAAQEVFGLLTEAISATKIRNSND